MNLGLEGKLGRGRSKKRHRTSKSRVSYLYILRNWTQLEKMYNLTKEEICGPCLEGDAEEEQEEQEECVPAFWNHPGVPGTVIAHLLLTTSLLLQVFVEWTCFREVCAREGRCYI